MSPSSQDVVLPAALFAGTSADQRQRFWEVMRHSELRKRERDGQVFVRADRDTQHIYLKPLQNADGELRADARATLIDDWDLGDMQRASELTDMLIALEDQHTYTITRVKRTRPRNLGRYPPALVRTS